MIDLTPEAARAAAEWMEAQFVRVSPRHFRSEADRLESAAHARLAATMSFYANRLGAEGDVAGDVATEVADLFERGEIDGLNAVDAGNLIANALTDAGLLRSGPDREALS